MKTSDFKFELPEELIAQHPLEKRDTSRLMVLDPVLQTIEHRQFHDILDYLKDGDVLVINETKVLPARIYGRKDTGAVVEFLLLREISPAVWTCLVKPGRRARVGDRFDIGPMQAEIIGIGNEGEREVRFHFEGVFLEILESIGTMPLPPYIHERLEDQNRYQTVYARQNGSAAAPTAGLHFTEELLKIIQDRGVKIARLTLHVGLGTFRPVKVDDVEGHRMHAEHYSLTEENASIIRSAKRVIAVGTTSVRTLETIARDHGEIVAAEGETDIFLYPGKEFLAVEALITNFHLPESTLIMLVSAFAGQDFILDAYRKAVEAEYRFFSFGDAMFIKGKACSNTP